MRFRNFILLEQDPMGGGGDPMGGGMPPSPAGGDPMGGGMGDPMAGGMGGPPMGGAAPTPPEPQPIPQHADVWDVLDSLLAHKPIEQEKKYQKYKTQKSELSDQNSQAAAPPPPPPGSQGLGDTMGGAPPGGAMSGSALMN